MKRIKLSYITKRTKINDVKVEDGYMTSSSEFMIQEKVDKLQNDACWRPYQKEFDETHKDQKDVSEWTFMDKNNIEIDVVKTICYAFDKQALIAMMAPPIKFHQNMDPTSEKYLEYLYKSNNGTASYISQTKKADTWIEMMIAKNLHEIVFTETSESPFQTTCTTKKVYNDKYKLIRFGHDSKNKMLDELIEKKCIFLSDWKNLYNDIRKAELLLFQAYDKLSFTYS
ncbi:264_t:CDS:2, partial [Cetraspora pellucida]